MGERRETPMIQTIGFTIVLLFAIGAIERIYRLDKTLRHINNMLVDLCEHLEVENGDDVDTHWMPCCRRRETRR